VKTILLGLFFATTLFSHNLQHNVSYEEGVVITFQFVKEGDFSYQNYEIYAPESIVPFQVGRTDAHARVLFLPDKKGIWKIKTFSEDGHGKLININIDKEKHIEHGIQKSDTILRAVGGLLFLFAVFGGIYYINKKRKDI